MCSDLKVLISINTNIESIPKASQKWNIEYEIEACSDRMRGYFFLGIFPGLGIFQRQNG